MKARGYQHTRQVSGIFDVLQNIAGIYELIIGFFGIFLYSVSKNKFVISAISKMFLIKTFDPNLFTKTVTNLQETDDTIDLKAKVRVRMRNSIAKIT